MSLEERVVSCLYNVDRHLLGRGVHYSLELINLFTSMQIKSKESGESFGDWVVPNEWVLYSAFIRNSNTNVALSHRDSTLRVLKYSDPISTRKLPEGLSGHIWLDEHIPYRTSYYSKNWGFCMSNSEWSALTKKGEIDANIDSESIPGKLYYGEKLIKGKVPYEILFTSYICHPSLVNDNLSGVSSIVRLMNDLETRSSNYFSYRFILMPETIGAVMLANELDFSKVLFGATLHCSSGKKNITFKKSPLSYSVLNTLVEEFNFDLVDFEPFGSDERQFSTFELDYGVFSRTPYAQFEEYHNSSDNLNSYSPEHHKIFGDKILEFIERADREVFYKISKKYSGKRGELFLSKHNLYRKVGGTLNNSDDSMIIINWALFLARSGFSSATVVASKSGKGESEVIQVLKLLKDASIIDLL